MWKKGQVAAAILSLAACGSDEKAASDGANDVAVEKDGGADSEPAPDRSGGVACDSLAELPELPNKDLAYPDSVCADGECREGGCDPLGRCLPACNAWRIYGKVSFQAAQMGAKLNLGYPALPSRADSDPCTGFMTSAKGADVNCCQRTDIATEKRPMLKLTGLTMSRPLTFANPAVTGLNKMAIEEDLYNSVLGLSSTSDGPLMVTMGSALPNRDGSFFPIKGAFTSGGLTFNEDGQWDVHADVPATLSAEGGGRMLRVGPSSADKDLVLLVWFDNGLDFARLALHLRGVEYELPLTQDLACAGARDPGGFFDLAGTLKAYLPLEAARKTNLYVNRGEGGATNLCTFTSSAKSCGADVAKWTQ